MRCCSTAELLPAPGVTAPPPFWVGILPFCWLPEGVCDPGPGCWRDQEAPSALSHRAVSPAPRALEPDGCSGSRGDMSAGPQHQLLPFVFLRSHFTRWLSRYRCRGDAQGLRASNRSKWGIFSCPSAFKQVLLYVEQAKNDVLNTARAEALNQINSFFDSPSF